MEWRQMSSDAAVGGGIMDFFSLLLWIFQRYNDERAFFFSLMKMWSSFKEKPGGRAQAGAAWVQVMAPQSGRCGGLMQTEAWGCPAPPGPPPVTGTEPGTTSLPSPALSSQSSGLTKNFLVPETRPTPEWEAARWIIFLREREKIKIKLTYFNRFPGSGPTVDSKLWCNSHQKQ